MLKSTKPAISVRIPTGDEVISKTVGAISGTLFGAVSEAEKDSKAFVNEKGFYQEFPDGSNVKVKNMKSVGKVCTVLTVGTAALDIGNTWSEDNGNTNAKRIGKTVIQLVGTGASAAVGTYVTGPIVAAAVVGAPETGGLSAGLLPVAASIDYGVSQLIDKGQNFLYDKFNIK